MHIPDFRCLAIISSQAFSLVNFRGELIRFLVRLGVKVYAFAPDYDDANRCRIKSLGAVPVDFVIDRVSLDPVAALKTIWTLNQRMRELRVDAVLSYFAKPVIYSSIAARLAGVDRVFSMIEGAGYVFSEDALSTLRRRILRWGVRRLYRISLHYSTCVFLLNRDDYALFVHGGLVCADKVHVIPGIGVDLHRFPLASPTMSPITFVFMARLLKEKGILDFVEAARRIRLKHPDVEFLVVGDVDANPDSIERDVIDGWCKERIVRWSGQVADVRRWLKQASVFVLPSYYREGMPRSIQEAMAIGRPIITTNWVGCRESIEDGVNGFLVPVRDPIALSQAMERFIDNPALILIMGRESRRLAESRFNVHHINKKILSCM